MTLFYSYYYILFYLGLPDKLHNYLLCEILMKIGYTNYSRKPLCDKYILFGERHNYQDIVMII